MATIEQLSNALINADKAGDVDAARQLAAEITRMRTVAAAETAPTDSRDSFMGRVDSVVRGAADTLSFGLADEFSAGADALFNPLLGTGQDGGSIGDRYSANLARQRGTDEADAENRAGYRIGGQVAGALTGGVGMAKSGMSLAANAVDRGASLARVSGASLADGALMGTAQGYGSGEGVQDRLYNSGIGLLAGGAIGGISPGAVAGASKVLKSAVAPLVAPFMPETYAQDAMAVALRRSGKTPEQIRDIMISAADDGQGVYNMGDAMGYTGQRLMSTSARVPHDARQMVAEALQRRQAGQGERLAAAVSDGFDATETAEARKLALTRGRQIEARQNYDQARADAGAVDVSPAIERIDETITPGVNQIVSPRDRMAYDTIEGALARERAKLTDGNSQLTDFNSVFRTKLDLDDAVTAAENKGAGNRAFYLSQVQDDVDNALAAASPTYANARDRFAAASRNIEAVDTGRASASLARRSADTIPAFRALPEDAQPGFRIGYADPLITKIEGASMSPTTNKARMLQTPKYQEEFQAFAAPGRAEQLGNRIGREQRMFDTANAALGGSRTADNLADAADMNQFDPSVISKLVKGDPIGAVTTGVAKALGTMTGSPPSVMEKVAKALIDTDPDAAFNVLRRGSKKLTQSDQVRAKVAAALMSSGAAGSGRLAP
jgi:hypothetical protein